jgi:hypothetical protein
MIGIGDRDDLFPNSTRVNSRLWRSATKKRSGGIGHTLPFFIPDFDPTTEAAVVVVVFEL